jgi:hypothetical protein
LSTSKRQGHIPPPTRPGIRIRAAFWSRHDIESLTDRRIDPSTLSVTVWESNVNDMIADGPGWVGHTPSTMMACCAQRVEPMRDRYFASSQSFGHA